MQEDEAEDVAFGAVAFCGRGGDDDALRGDHFAHDASGGVGRGHEVGRDAELLRGELLQAAEEDVGGGVGAGGGGADPADEGSEEGIEGSGAGEGEAEGGVHSAVAGDEADGHEGGDGDDSKADATMVSRKTWAMTRGCIPMTRPAMMAATRIPVPVAESQLRLKTAVRPWVRERPGACGEDLMEAGDGDLHAGGGVEPLRETRHTPEDDADSKDDPGKCGAQDDLAAVGGGLEGLVSDVSDERR